MLVTKTSEFDKWFDKLKDDKAKSKITVRLRRISENGNFGDFKLVGDGVHELRIDYRPGYRVYYGKRGEEIILLLAGGDKSTQKTDIEKAKNIWKLNS